MDAARDQVGRREEVDDEIEEFDQSQEDSVMLDTDETDNTHPVAPNSPTAEELQATADRIAALETAQLEKTRAELQAMKEANKNMAERVAKAKTIEKEKREGDVARAIELASMAAEKKQLEEEANRLRATLSETNKGNSGTLTDLHGKKAFVDVDLNYFMVRDQKKASVRALSSLRSRRLTDRGRHEALFGDEGIELDTGRVHKCLVQRGVTDVFGYGRMTEEELVCWAPLQLFEEVKNLPIMTADGVHAFQCGEARSLHWFLPAGEAQVLDLGSLKRALTNMEKVYMVQHSMLFEGMNTGIIDALSSFQVRFSTKNYVIHWVEANMCTFNQIVGSKYPALVPIGWPSDIASAANCRYLWMILVARLDANLHDFQQRVFERSVADKSLTSASIKSDTARSKSLQSGDSPDSDSDPEDPHAGRNKRKREAAKLKKQLAKKDAGTTAAEKPGKPSGGKTGGAPGATPDKKANLAKKVVLDKKTSAVTPDKKEGPYCGAHIAGTLSIGDGCQFSDCKFAHLPDLTKAEMFRVDRALCTGWGMKLGNDSQLKVWNAMVEQTKEGKARPPTFKFVANKPAFTFGKDT